VAAAELKELRVLEEMEEAEAVEGREEVAMLEVEWAVLVHPASTDSRVKEERTDQAELRVPMEDSPKVVQFTPQGRLP